MCHSREPRTHVSLFNSSYSLKEDIPQGIRIPAGSMNLTHSTDLQEEGQEGLITP